MQENRATSQPRRLKVLISAFAFSPYQGSEGGAGWNIATRLAKFHDVTVLIGDLTRDHREKIKLDQWLVENGPIEGLEVIYIAPDRKMLFWVDMAHQLPALWFLYYHAYKLWLLKTYATAQALHASRKFEICHQLTYLTYREPGYLWKMGVPFFWGPVSGTDNVPPSFYLMLGFAEHGRIWLRDALNGLHLHLAFRSARAARAASMVWGVSRKDIRLIGKSWKANHGQLFETGTEAILGTVRQRCPEEPLKLVWCGFHVTRKALPILLNALSRLSTSSPWCLEILGDGPMTAQWKQVAINLHLPPDRIHWAGFIPKDEVMKRMRGADILIQTSLREATSTVVMEALSMGLPVICHDACGMAAAVTERCGIKVPLKNPESSFSGFRAAIMRLIEEPTLLEQLSSGALERAKDLTWDGIASTIAEAYSRQYHETD
jgi:glycosyltransferase involved in cell wall biosynthesis